jgi:hypothetical protein
VKWKEVLVTKGECMTTALNPFREAIGSVLMFHDLGPSGGKRSVSTLSELSQILNNDYQRWQQGRVMSDTNNPKPARDEPRATWSAESARASEEQMFARIA